MKKPNKYIYYKIIQVLTYDKWEEVDRYEAKANGDFKDQKSKSLFSKFFHQYREEFKKDCRLVHRRLINPEFTAWENAYYKILNNAKTII